jgi:large subunit ribosomal protein L30
MIIAIRISGLVEIPQKVNEALFRLRLRRKYTSTLLLPTKENLTLLKKLRNTIAYGIIDEKTLEHLISKRGQSIDKKKLNAGTLATEILNQEKKNKLNLAALGLKPFFRLHPPIGGIDTKVHFPIRKGVLGDNGEKINDLVRRML